MSTGQSPREEQCTERESQRAAESCRGHPLTSSAGDLSVRKGPQPEEDPSEGGEGANRDTHTRLGTARGPPARLKSLTGHWSRVQKGFVSIVEQN